MLFTVHLDLRKTQKCGTGTFTHGTPLNPASFCSGRSVLIQAGSREMHSNIHAQHLIHEKYWAMVKRKAEKPEWLLMERASGLSQSRGTVMDPQQLCRSSQVSQYFRSFKGSCGICPPVWQQLQVNSASCYSEQESDWLNFFYSLKSEQKPQHCLSFFISWRTLYELNKTIIITWTEIRFFQKPRQEVLQHIWKARNLPPGEIRASPSRDKTQWWDRALRKV